MTATATATTTTTTIKALTWAMQRDLIEVEGGGIIASTALSGRSMTISGLPLDETLDRINAVFRELDSGGYQPRVEFQAAIEAVCENLPATCRVAFSGFEFSQRFRAETEEILGVQIPVTPMERRFREWFPAVEVDVAQDCYVWEVEPYEAPRGCSWSYSTPGHFYGPGSNRLKAGEKCRFWLSPDSPEAARDALIYKELVPKAIRVIRGYSGTRLYSALRRAGLGEILDSRYLDVAIAAARS